MNKKAIDSSIRKMLREGFESCLKDFSSIMTISDKKEYTKHVISAFQLYRRVAIRNEAMQTLARIHNINFNELLEEEYQRAVKAL